MVVFDMRGGYGIFDRVFFFGRSLFWICEELGGMWRIEFFKEGLGWYRVLFSWLWMVYMGVIGFMDLLFEGVYWLEDDVWLLWGVVVWEMSFDISGLGNSIVSFMWYIGCID